MEWCFGLDKIMIRSLEKNTLQSAFKNEIYMERCFGLNTIMIRSLEKYATKCF